MDKTNFSRTAALIAAMLVAAPITFLTGTAHAASEPHLGVSRSDRLVIRHVIFNPQLEATAFVPPPLPLRHGGGSLVHIPGNAPGGPVTSR